jgi:hypothetical protein
MMMTEQEKQSHLFVVAYGKLLGFAPSLSEVPNIPQIKGFSEVLLRN